MPAPSPAVISRIAELSWLSELGRKLIAGDPVPGRLSHIVEHTIHLSSAGVVTKCVGGDYVSFDEGPNMGHVVAIPTARPNEVAIVPMTAHELVAQLEGSRKWDSFFVAYTPLGNYLLSAVPPGVVIPEGGEEGDPLEVAISLSETYNAVGFFADWEHREAFVRGLGDLKRRLEDPGNRPGEDRAPIVFGWYEKRPLYAPWEEVERLEGLGLRFKEWWTREGKTIRRANPWSYVTVEYYRG